MDSNEWLLANNAGELIRRRVADAERRHLPADLPRPVPQPRRHQLAQRLRRIADTLDN